MIEYYQQLLQEERDEVTEAIKLLQTQTFVLEKKYDKKAARYVVNRSYRACEKHFDFIKEYFQIADIDVIENRQYGIIGIQSSHSIGDKLSKLTSVFLLLLKLLYDEKMNTASNSIHVYVTLEEIYEKIQIFSLWDNRSISPTDLRRTLSALKKYQVIEVLELMQEVTPETKLIVYPTINMLLHPEAVRNIIAQYQDVEEQEDE